MFLAHAKDSINHGFRNGFKVKIGSTYALAALANNLNKTFIGFVVSIAGAECGTLIY